MPQAVRSRRLDPSSFLDDRCIDRPFRNNFLDNVVVCPDGSVTWSAPSPAAPPACLPVSETVEIPAYFATLAAQPWSMGQEHGPQPLEPELLPTQKFSPSAARYRVTVTVTTTVTIVEE